MYDVVLSEYIASGLFLAESSNLPYDCIIAEQPFPDQKQGDIPLILFSQDKNIQQVLADGFKRFHHPLLIIDRLSIPFLLPLISTCKALTVVSLHAGYLGIGKVMFPIFDDVSSFQQQGFSVYEPYDTVSLRHELASATGKTFIRVTDHQLAHTVKNTGAGDLLSIASHIPQAAATLLFSGAYLPLAAGVADALQKINASCEVFCLLRYDGAFAPELVDSIHRTGRLILIVDQKPDAVSLQQLKVQIVDAGDVQVQLITPLYDRLTTVLPEYQAEQLQFDLQGIVERVHKIIG